jgi:hypothetical protein
MSRSRWIALTALAAASAWLLGALSFMALPDNASFTALLPVLIPLGIGLGALLGSAQWLELRSHAHASRIWIPANAAGWGLGLAVSFVAPISIDADTSTALAGALALLSGAATGITPGAITGWALVRLVQERDRNTATYAALKLRTSR